MTEQRQADGTNDEVAADAAAATHSPFVDIYLDKPRRLKLDLNAMICYEETTGRKFTEIGGKSLELTELRLVLWVMLLHEDPDLTVEEVGGMVHMGNVGELTTAIRKAVTLGTAKKKAHPPRAKGRRRPTG